MQSLRAKIAVLQAAIRGRLQVTGRSGDEPREFCPHALGRKGKAWHVLAWQFAGGSRSGLPAQGQWRCFDLDRLEGLAARPGEWHRGEATGQGEQSCIDAGAIDTEVDPAFGPQPHSTRRLGAGRRR
jgi:predicted DNA-binding transcriptional regulator YafY